MGLPWWFHAQESTLQGDFLGGSVAKNPPANAGDTGLAPGWGTKIPHAARCRQNKKQLKHNLNPGSLTLSSLLLLPSLVLSNKCQAAIS